MARAFLLAPASIESMDAYINKLLPAMKPKHANNACKMWVQLIASTHTTECVMSAPYFRTILEVVKQNVLDLVTDCQGVRIVTEVCSSGTFGELVKSPNQFT